MHACMQEKMRETLHNIQYEDAEYPERMSALAIDFIQVACVCICVRVMCVSVRVLCVYVSVCVLCVFDA